MRATFQSGFTVLIAGALLGIALPAGAGDSRPEAREEPKPERAAASSDSPERRSPPPAETASGAREEPNPAGPEASSEARERSSPPHADTPSAAREEETPEKSEAPAAKLKSRQTAFSADLLVPASSAYGTPGVGYGASIGTWINFDQVTLHPRIGLRYGPGAVESHFFDVSADFAAMWISMPGPIAPVAGGGVGLRFVSARGPTQTTTTGDVLKVTRRSASYAAGPGFTAFARSGMIFFRTSEVSASFLVDAGTAVIEGMPNPIFVTSSIGVQF